MTEENKNLTGEYINKCLQSMYFAGIAMVTCGGILIINGILNKNIPISFIGISILSGGFYLLWD